MLSSILINLCVNKRKVDQPSEQSFFPLQLKNQLISSGIESFQPGRAIHCTDIVSNGSQCIRS